MSATPLIRVQGFGHVAVKYGLDEAVFLDQILHWYRVNRAEERNFYDGRWWTYNTLSTYEVIFPWWSAKQLRRIVNSCKEKGALLCGCYNEDQRDRTLWYSPSDALLELYGEPGPSICPNGQMDVSERAHTCADLGTALPRRYQEDTQIPPIVPQEGDEPAGEKAPEERPATSGRQISKPKYRPEWFEPLWKFYPVHKARQDACRAWDKLKPDRDFCRMMYESVRLQKRSEQWVRDNGAYIPHFSRWLNGRKWEDEVRLAAPPGLRDDFDGGWAADPEVTD